MPTCRCPWAGGWCLCLYPWLSPCPSLTPAAPAGSGAARHCPSAPARSPPPLRRRNLFVVFACKQSIYSGCFWSCRMSNNRAYSYLHTVQRTIFAIRHVFVPPQVGSIWKCCHVQTRNHGLTFKIASTLGTAHDQTNIMYGGSKKYWPPRNGHWAIMCFA